MKLFSKHVDALAVALSKRSVDSEAVQIGVKFVGNIVRNIEKRGIRFSCEPFPLKKETEELKIESIDPYGLNYDIIQINLSKNDITFGIILNAKSKLMDFKLGMLLSQHFASFGRIEYSDLLYINRRELAYKIANKLKTAQIDIY